MLQYIIMKSKRSGIRELRHLACLQAQIDQLDPMGDPHALLLSGPKEPRGSVIVFTGSFNPPTTAHLALLKQAGYYAAQHHSMHVYAAFSKQTVDKESVTRPLLVERVNLLQQLLHHRLPQVGILLFNRGLYVEQAQALRQSFPAIHRMYFLMGFDKIVQILDPRYYIDRDASLQALFHLAHLLVAPRGNDGPRELLELIHQPQNERFAPYIHPMPLSIRYRTISSTQIRNSGLLHEHDIPWEVRNFMRTTRAYAPPLRRPDGSEVDIYGERMYTLKHLLREVHKR